MVSAYELLNVSHNATEEEILRAYRVAMLRYHPDRNSSPEAAAKARQLNRAKDVLTDPVKRARYDQYLERMRQQVTNNSTGSADKKNANTGAQSTPKPANEGYWSTSVSSDAREMGHENRSQHSQSTDKGVRGKRPSKQRKRSSSVSFARVVANIFTGSLALWILLAFLFKFDPLHIRTRLQTAFSENIGMVMETNNSQPIATDFARSNPYDAKKDMR